MSTSLLPPPPALPGQNPGPSIHLPLSANVPQPGQGGGAPQHGVPLPPPVMPPNAGGLADPKGDKRKSDGQKKQPKKRTYKTDPNVKVCQRTINRCHERIVDDRKFDKTYQSGLFRTYKNSPCALGILLAAAKTKNGVVLRYGAASGAMRITPDTKKEFMRLIDEALQTCVYGGNDSATPGAELLKDYVFPPVTGGPSGQSAGVPPMMPAHNIRIVRFNYVTDDVERRHLIEAKRTDDEQKRRVKDEKRQKKKDDVKPPMPVNARGLMPPQVNMPQHRMGMGMDLDDGKDDKDHDHLGVKRQRLDDGQQRSAAATAAVAAAVAAAAAAAQRTPSDAMAMDDGRPNTRKRRNEEP